VFVNVFSWSTQKSFDGAHAFQEFFPLETEKMYARVMCEVNGSAYCAVSLAEAWAHTMKSSQYKHLPLGGKINFLIYPSQCTLITSIAPSTRAKKAAQYWQQSHIKEIEKCRNERDYALDSLVSSYFPEYSDSIDWIKRKDQVGVALREINFVSSSW